MKIVAIGGGEIGRPGHAVETTKIDKRIIALAGKKSPNLLFLPTASHDSAGYVETVEKHFGKRLGCRVDALLLWNPKITRKEIREKIAKADIVYVGGGNTLHMLARWKKLGVDRLLKKAALRGCVMSGLSAGAVCWFAYAHSDSLKMRDKSADYTRVKGLGWYSYMVCPHFDVEKGRAPSLKRMLKKHGGMAIAIDNCAALEIVDDTYHIITAKSRARVYLCHWKGGRYSETIIPGTGSLAGLFHNKK